MSKRPHAQLHINPSALPAWFSALIDSIRTGNLDELVRFQQPADIVVRESAVLILFGEGLTGPDVLIIERAAEMRSHAGQPAFPGGACEAEDASPVVTALREAWEETNLDPSGVTVVATLPPLWLPPSGFIVIPVIGWWHESSPVSVGDPLEVAAVHRVAISDLANPANRVRVSHPTGYVGPGFEVSGMLVWGFTGMILDRLISLAGWELPWESGARVVPFDDGYHLPKDRGAAT